MGHIFLSIRTAETSFQSKSHCSSFTKLGQPGRPQHSCVSSSGTIVVSSTVSEGLTGLHMLILIISFWGLILFPHCVHGECGYEDRLYSLKLVTQDFLHTFTLLFRMWFILSVLGERHYVSKVSFFFFPLWMMTSTIWPSVTHQPKEASK